MSGYPWNKKKSHLHGSALLTIPLSLAWRESQLKNKDKKLELKTLKNAIKLRHVPVE